MEVFIRKDSVLPPSLCSLSSNRVYSEIHKISTTSQSADA